MTTKPECYTKKQWKYITSISGYPHSEAIKIIDELEAEIQKLNEFCNKMMEISRKQYAAMMALNLGMGSETLLRQSIMDLRKLKKQIEKHKKEKNKNGN